jgi:hypothetical protein
LYRSAARCHLLRAMGAPAQLRIGVRQDAGSAHRVAAHAWVTLNGVPLDDETGATYQMLDRARP